MNEYENNHVTYYYYSVQLICLQKGPDRGERGKSVEAVLKLIIVAPALCSFVLYHFYHTF